MVVSCSAPGCSAKRDNANSKSSIQFHRFPLRKPDILAKWVKAMKRANFKPTATSYLCSAHFTSSDYDIKPNNAGKYLRPNAVPSYFEKRKPGRKKKVQVENETSEGGKEDVNGEEYLENKEPDEIVEEEYLEVGTSEKVESNLAEIIGDQDKGTLHVLIVGEDGKITNSEYIFKKELSSDDEFKPDVGILAQECKRDPEEDVDLLKDSIDDKGSQTDVSSDLMVFNYRDLKNREKIKRLESALSVTRKKVKVLQMKCRRMNKRTNELKLLLKLLVLKKGKGEKTLKELLEEYEKCELDEIVRDEDLDF